MSKYWITGLLAICAMVWLVQQDFSPWKPFAPGSVTPTSRKLPGQARPQDPASGPANRAPSLSSGRAEAPLVRYSQNAPSSGGYSTPANVQQKDERMDRMREYMQNMLSGRSSPPSPMDLLHQKLQFSLSQYQTATNESGARAALRMEISDLLTQQYDAHVQQYEQQVAELESRLANLREHVQKRRDAKSRLVALKLELLLSQAEGMGWPEAFPTPPVGTPFLPPRGGLPSETIYLPSNPPLPGNVPAANPNPTPTPTLPTGLPLTELDGSSQLRHEAALKRILLGFHNYDAAYHALPFFPRPEDSERLSWRVRILPYLDDLGGTDLFNQFDLSEAWDSKKNRALLDRMPDVFGTGRQTNVRWIESDVRSFTEIADGASNTIACIVGGPPVYWTENRPMSPFEATEIFKALTLGGGLTVGMYDGSVRTLTIDVGVEVFEAMLTPAGGEVIP